VNLLALAYGIGAIVNILWPRSPNDPWYSNYSMLVPPSESWCWAHLHGGAKTLRARQCAGGDAHRLARHRSLNLRSRILRIRRAVASLRVGARRGIIAAVDAHVGTRHVTREIGRQKMHATRDLVDAPDAPSGCRPPAPQILARRRRGLARMSSTIPRVDLAGTHRIDGILSRA